MRKQRVFFNTILSSPIFTKHFSSPWRQNGIFFSSHELTNSVAPEPDGSLPRPQEPATVPYSEPP
jgi:hypothetical protein